MSPFEGLAFLISATSPHSPDLTLRFEGCAKGAHRWGFQCFALETGEAHFGPGARHFLALVEGDLVENGGHFQLPDTATSLSSAALALPEEMLSRASATPLFISGVLPAMMKAAPAVMSTAVR